MDKQLYIKKTGFVEKHIGNELVIVPLVNSVAKMEKVFSLNELGSFIYNLLSSEQSKDQLLDSILEEFNIDYETAAKDLQLFLNKTVESGIVVNL